MSSEFRIRVDVDLDTSEAESKMKSLQDLGDNGKIKLEVDLSDLKSDLNSISSALKNAFKIDTSSLGDLNKLTTALKEVNNIGKTTTNSNINAMISEYKDLYNTIEKLQKQMNSGNMSVDGIERTTSQISELTTKMNALKSEIQELGAGSKIELFDSSKMNKAMTDMNQYMTKIETTATSLQTKLNGINFDHIDTSTIEKLQNELKEIQDIAKQDINLDLDVGSVLSDLNKLSTEIKNLEKVENLASSFDKVKSSASSVGVEIEDISSSIKELESVASSLDGSFDKAFSGLKSDLSSISSEVKSAATEMSSGGGLLGTWDDFVGNFSQFTLAEVAGDFISDGIRQMASALKDTIVETDEAITNLMKVAPDTFSGTGQQLQSYLQDVQTVAKGTGQSIVEVINATASALQTGIKTIDDSLAYAEQVAIYANTGDMSQETASTQIAAIMSAYGGVENALLPVREQIKGASEDYSTLAKYTDLANYAGNNFASSSADVGTILMESSSALSTMGVSMEEAVGMGVAMNEVLQDSSKSGNAMKSIASSLAGVSASASDGTLQMNKVSKALQEIAGIEVWDQQTGQIKDMYEVMDELAFKWDDLSEAEQTALGSAIAGKTQLNAFNALLSNWETAKQLVQDYNNGLTVGSAYEENLRYLDSIEGKWNAIKTNLQSIGTTIFTSDMVKGAMDVVVTITDVLNKGVTGISDSISKIMSKGFKGFLDDSYFEFFEKIDFGGKIAGAFTFIPQEISNALSSVFGSNNVISGFIDNIISEISSKTTANKINSTFSDAFSGIGDFMGEMLFKANSPLLGTDALMEKIFGTSVGTTIKEWFANQQLDDQIEIRQQNIQAMQSEIAQYKAQQSAIAEVGQVYDELSKKQNLSAEEQAQYNEAVQALAQLAPDSVLGYDTDGTPILKTYGSINDEIQRQIDLNSQALRLEQNRLALDTMQQQANNAKEATQAYQEYLDVMSQTTSDSMRKDSLLSGKESLQDYAKRLQEANNQITQQQAQAYQERAEAHQQYLEAEKAIQQRYLNEMTSDTSFQQLSDSMKSSLLTMADSLDWSQLSLAEGDALSRQLTELGDKFVETSDQMGKSSTKIKQLGEDFASGKIGITDYTNELAKAYEAEGKFDGQSFTQWRQGLQDFADSTGNMQVVQQNIDTMAESLNKITGIDTSVWQKALNIDPAPIDASNAALQRFLQSYGTGIQNLGKGGLADNLKDQFTALSDFHTQLIDTLASGNEVDAEFLVNASVNMPKPIQSLIDEIVADGEVSEEEIEVLLMANAEILNTGEISDDTIKQIADTLGMTEAEVRMMLRLDVEVEDDGYSEVEQYIRTWGDLTDEEKELLLRMSEEGAPEFEEAVANWDNLTNEQKRQVLLQLLEGEKDFQEKIDNWENLPEEEKTQTLRQLLERDDLLDSVIPNWERLTDEEKELKLKQMIEGNEELQYALENWDRLDDREKIQLLTQLVEGNYEVKQAADEWEGMSDEDKLQTLKQILEEDGSIQSAIANWDRLTDEEKEQILKQLLEGDEEIQSALENWDKLDDREKVQLLIQMLQQDGDINVAIDEWEKMSDEEKIQTLRQLVEEDGSIQSAVANWDRLTEEEKQQILKQLVEEDGNLAIAIANWDKLDDREKVQLLIQMLQQDGNIEGASEEYENAPEGTKNQTLNQNATGTEEITSAKNAIEGVPESKTSTLTAVDNASPSASNATNSINNVPLLHNTDINASDNASTPAITAKGNVESVPTSHNTDINASDNASSKAQTVTDKVKEIPLTKTVTLSAVDRASSIISTVVGWLKQLTNKTVSVSATKTLTTINKVVNVPGVGTMTKESSVSTKPMSISTTLVPPSDDDIFTTFSDYENGFTTMSNDFTTFALTKATSSTPINLDWKSIDDSIWYGIEMFQELQNRIDKVNNSLDLLDSMMENAIGKDKIKYLKQQIVLYQEQQKLQKSLISDLEYEQRQLQNTLKDQGFAFNDDGNLTNYEEKLLSLENTYYNLQQATEKAQKAQNDYTGDDETTKNNLKAATEKAQEAEEKFAEQLEHTKDVLSEYLDITFSELPNAQLEWQELANSIKDAEDEIEQFNKEMAQLKLDAELLTVDRYVRQLTARIEVLDARLESLSGQDKINAVKKMIGYYEDLTKELQNELDVQEKIKKSLESQLEDYGLDVRHDSILGDYIYDYENAISQLKQNLSADEFEEVLDLVESYYDVSLDTIPELQEELIDINKTIKDLYEDQLDTAKDVEDKITDIYKDELEKQINAMKKATDEKIALLQKELDAYNDMRNAMDYQNDVQDQVAIIEDLNRQIELAKRDTSLSGQAKLRSLMEELADAQKDFEKLTQDRIDEQINSMYQDEMDRLSEQNEKAVEELENQWSDARIAEAVENALKTNLFTDLNGQVMNLQDAMLNYAEEAGETFGVMGDYTLVVE